MTRSSTTSSTGVCLVSADGQSVVWASRLLGDPLPSASPGSTSWKSCSSLPSGEASRVYFLGARSEVLELALQRLRDRYPRLQVAGARDGYFADDESAEVCEAIRASNADLLFVAMSSPRKEYFLGEYGPSFRAPFVMGVGGESTSSRVSHDARPRAGSAWDSSGCTACSKSRGGCSVAMRLPTLASCTRRLGNVVESRRRVKSSTGRTT